MYFFLFFFLLVLLKIFFSYLLAFTVSGEKSAILIFVSLYILWLSLLSDSLYIIDFKQFDSDMHWFCFLHIHCGWDSLNFLDLGAHSFHQIWNIFGYYFFKGFFSVPFSLLIQKLKLCPYWAAWHDKITYWYSVLFLFYSLFSRCFILDTWFCCVFTLTSRLFWKVGYLPVISSSVFLIRHGSSHLQKFNLAWCFHLLSVSFLMYGIQS